MSSLSSPNTPAETPAAAIPPRRAGAPDELAAAQQLADSLFAAGNLDEAATLYAGILEKQPGSVEALYALGRLFKRRGQLDAAIECYRSAAALRPNAPNIYFNMAGALREAGQMKDAARSYEQVIVLQPNDMEAHFLLAVVRNELEEFEAAAEAYRGALALKPDFPEALSNLGAVYTKLGDLRAAEDSIRRALELAPEYANAHANLANLLHRKGDNAASIASFLKALALEPRHPKALFSFGALLSRLGDMQEARRCFRSALAIEPGFTEARFHLSVNLLAAGEYVEGWREYESRWQWREQSHAKRSFAQPQWRGEAIRGGRIFLYSEQGLGDTIQFVRFAPMVAELGAEVVLEVQPDLERLLKDIHPAVRVVSPGMIVDHTPFDWQCPLLSLPLAFQIELGTIPAKVPYLRADPLEAHRWRERLQRDGGGQECLRVGLVWAGNPKSSRDALRSLVCEQLSGLLRAPGAIFYGLQKGPAAEQLLPMAAELPVINLAEHLNDFADTAAILTNLDLLISVDTSVAHLAAAIGKPVWILLNYDAEWRWLRSRNDSPWYPTVRLFRQTAEGCWDGVLREVQQRLAALLESHREQAARKAISH